MMAGAAADVPRQDANLNLKGPWSYAWCAPDHSLVLPLPWCWSPGTQGTPVLLITTECHRTHPPPCNVPRSVMGCMAALVWLTAPAATPVTAAGIALVQKGMSLVQEGNFQGGRDRIVQVCTLLVLCLPYHSSNTPGLR